MTRFERRLLWSSTIAVALTGFIYMAMKYALEPAQPWDAVNHPLQPLVLKLHILTAPFLVFAIGLVTQRHIWRHYRENMRTARRTGITIALFTVPMVVTGYLIQAVTHMGWLRALVWGHIACSIVFTAGMGLHFLARRRYASTRRVAERREASAAPGAPASAR